MSKIKIYFSNHQKDTVLPKDFRTSLRKCCEAVLTSENIKEQAEVSVTVVTKPEIQRINSEYRNIDKVTDVLSFPLSENREFETNLDTGCIMLGDIVICAQRAEEQAEEYGHSLLRELCFLATHSMLHLLGYDHEQGKEQEKIMFEKQNKILEDLGITR